MLRPKAMRTPWSAHGGVTDQDRHGAGGHPDAAGAGRLQGVQDVVEQLGEAAHDGGGHGRRRGDWDGAKARIAVHRSPSSSHAVPAGWSPTVTTRPSTPPTPAAASRKPSAPRSPRSTASTVLRSPSGVGHPRGTRTPSHASRRWPPRFATASPTPLGPALTPLTCVVRRSWPSGSPPGVADARRPCQPRRTGHPRAAPAGPRRLRHPSRRQRLRRPRGTPEAAGQQRQP